MKAPAHLKRSFGCFLLSESVCFSLTGLAAEAPDNRAISSSGLVPLELKLPEAAFKGTPPEFEDNRGKLIDAKGVAARYIRFYSRGSTQSPLNEYTEIEVYGRSAASITDHK